MFVWVWGFVFVFFLFFISFPGRGLLPVIKALRQNVWALPISPVTPRCSVWRGDTGPTSAPQRYRPAAGAREGQAAEMLAGLAACKFFFCVFRAPLKRGARAELNFAGMDSLRAPPAVPGCC